MSFRLRLLLGTVAVVGASLVLAGALTGLLVANVQYDQAYQQLAILTVTTRNAYTQSQPRPTTAAAVVDRLNTVKPVGADRMLVLGPRGEVVYDSDPTATAVGQGVSLGHLRRVSEFNLVEGQISVAGSSYLAEGVPLPLAPIAGRELVLLRSTSAVNAIIAQRLLPRLLLAGSVALLLAVIVVLLLSRGFTRPLSELAAAAEGIAAGDYSRRVAATGADEVGVVGRSFNRMAEAVERSRAQQRDFLANVSHELKTPLTSLIGFSEALRDGTLEKAEERHKAATIIHQEAHRVLRMSQELLDLARMETGQISFHPSAVDLRALLDQELEVVRPRADGRGLKLDLSAAEALRPVRADRERLGQIISNLLDNAVKYAPDQSPVRVLASDGGQDAEVIVENRVGEHPPDPARMFERFYRADPSRSSAVAGVGLGLAISREMAEAMGGRLSAELVDSTLRMRLTLPL